MTEKSPPLNRERNNKMNEIFNCLKQIYESKFIDRSNFHLPEGWNSFELDSWIYRLQNNLQKLLDSSRENFILHMLKTENKRYYLKGFRKSMDHIQKFIENQFMAEKEKQFEDFKFWILTQKFVLTNAQEFTKFKERASRHAFFQPYFIGENDYVKAKEKNDKKILDILIDSSLYDSEKLDKVLKIFKRNDDIYYMSYGGPDQAYDNYHLGIFLKLKATDLANFLERPNDDPHKIRAMHHITDTAYDWAMILHNAGETTDNKSKYKVVQAMLPIKQSLIHNSTKDAKNKPRNFAEILKITNFENDLEKNRKKIMELPRWYMKLNDRLGKESCETVVNFSQTTGPRSQTTGPMAQTIGPTLQTEPYISLYHMLKCVYLFLRLVEPNHFLPFLVLKIIKLSNLQKYVNALYTHMV